MMPKVKPNKKWKILFTIPNFDTAGSGKALLNLCSRLDKKFFKSYISCSHSKGSLFKKVISSRIPFYINNNQVEMKPRLEGVFKCYQLSKFFKKLDMDLIHSFHYGPDYSEALASKIAGIPWVYTKKNMNWGGSSKNGWGIRSLLSSHILMQNRDMQNLFFNKLKKTSLVPRGVDTKKFFPKKKKISLIKKYNIHEGEVVILTVANLSPVKGIDFLLNAFIKLSYKYNFIKLFLVGNKDNDYGKMIENTARKSLFKSNIHFVGKVDEVIDYYSIADIFVLPTIKKGEGCPVSLLEAMSCGVSPLGSNVSGIKDILDPFPQLLFSPGDADSLAEKIEDLILEKEDKKKIYREHILNEYDISVEVNAHEKIYKKLLKIN